MDFIPGSSKKYLQQTLEYFDVNRVEVMSVSEFIRQYESYRLSSKYYALRSYVPGGKFFHYLEQDELYMLTLTPKLVNDKSHYVSETMYFHDRDDLICNGEALLYKDEFNTWTWAGFVCREKGIPLRLAYTSDKLTYIRNRHQVPRPIFDLIWSKKLIGYVVEFSIFSEKVGIKKQNVLIWEIRKY